MVASTSFYCSVTVPLLSEHALLREVSNLEMEGYSRYQRARKIKTGEEQFKEEEIKEDRVLPLVDSAQNRAPIKPCYLREKKFKCEIKAVKINLFSQ